MGNGKAIRSEVYNLSINLEYYKILYYVAKYGSFTQAADELCITQPAVSQAVKTLESALGNQLFVRSAKGVVLTKEGEILYSYVKRGYESILLGESTFKKLLDLENGEIRIGASDMTLKFYLLPHLERFHERYPGIKVKVTNAPTPETLENLMDGKIDFGIVSTPFEGGSEIKTTIVRKLQDVFIAGNKFLSLKNRTLQYEDLTKYPCICLEKNTSTRAYMDEFLQQQKIDLVPEFELATSDMIVQFVKRNLGIGYVVADFAKPQIEQGEVFELMFNQKLPERNICIVSSDKYPLSTAAKELLHRLKES